MMDGLPTSHVAPAAPTAPLKPLSAIPEEKAKEWVSVAYVRAIAAQVGLNVGSVEWDDGIDMQIGSTKGVVPGFDWQNLWISLQLKATANWEVQNGRIAFFLKQHNYDRLRTKSLTRQYLVLYTLPKGRGRSFWICQQPDHVDLQSRAFYLDLLNAPELQPKNGRQRSGRTVYVPVQNRLTAYSLRRLYLDAAESAKTMLAI